MNKRLRRILERVEGHDFDSNPGPDRLTAISRLYGLSADDYATMIASQAGGCAICGGKSIGGKSQSKKYLAVDHDHATGKVRGLLCNHCNTGLGMFKDSPDLMRLAIAYLER